MLIVVLQHGMHRTIMPLDPSLTAHTSKCTQSIPSRFGAKQNCAKRRSFKETANAKQGPKEWGNGREPEGIPHVTIDKALPTAMSSYSPESPGSAQSCSTLRRKGPLPAVANGNQRQELGITCSTVDFDNHFNMSMPRPREWRCSTTRSSDTALFPSSWNLASCSLADPVRLITGFPCNKTLESPSGSLRSDSLASVRPVA